jgi:hypothetical protein
MNFRLIRAMVEFVDLSHKKVNLIYYLWVNIPKDK